MDQNPSNTTLSRLTRLLQFLYRYLDHLIVLLVVLSSGWYFYDINLDETHKKTINSSIDNSCNDSNPIEQIFVDTSEHLIHIRDAKTGILLQKISCNTLDDSTCSIIETNIHPQNKEYIK